MSSAPITTDSAAILGQAWPENSTETASEQLAAVQQLSAAMSQEVQTRATAAGSMRAAADSSNFDVGHSARDSRISAYAAQAQTANSVLTQAWWAILGHSRALEDALTSIVYAYQPRLDAARVLAATDPTAGETAYNEAMAEAIAEREAALATAVAGVGGQLSILASTSSASPGAGSGGSTLGLFHGVANTTGVVAGAAGAALAAGTNGALAEFENEAAGKAGEASDGMSASSGSTLSGFNAAADSSGGGGVASSANSASSTMSGFQSEASSASSPALSAADGQSASQAGPATAAPGDLNTGGSGASVSGGRASSAAAQGSADSASTTVPDTAATASGNGPSSAGDPAGSEQITMAPATVTAQSAVAASPAPMASAGAASTIAAPAPPAMSVGPGPAVMSGASASGAPAPISLPPAAGPGVSQSAPSIVRSSPGIAFSPGMGAAAAAASTGGGTAGAAASTSGVVAGAVGGTAANPVNYAAVDKSVSGGLRYALATVAALVQASRDVAGIGWAVAGATSTDGQREFLFTSNMGGGYIPVGVHPYEDLVPAFSLAPTASDVSVSGDPAVALVEWQRAHVPDWQLTSIASSMPVGGLRGLVDPEITHVRQLSAEDPAGMAMTELTEFTRHRLDVVLPGSVSRVLSADAAKDYFQLAWVAHHGSQPGRAARARGAVLDALASAREPMPAVWDDLNAEYLAQAAQVAGWGPLGEDAQRYWSAFTDLMASEAILLGRGRLTPDRMADVIYAVTMSAGSRIDVTELPLKV